MDFGIYAGDTSKTIYVFLQDSTTGLAKTGIAYNSAGAIASYNLPLAARSAITLATQTVTGAWSSGGFVEVDATNEPGVYRFDVPNAAIASGSYTVITLAFTGVKTCAVLIPLHVRSVNVTQWLGTAAATPTVAGVPEVDVTHLLGTAWLTPTTAGKPDVNVLTMTTNVISASVLAANTGLKPLYTGSVTSGSATTYVMSGITAANDDINGYRLRITSGAMIGQIRMIKDWISGTSTLELDTAFSTALSAADTFVIEPAQVNVKHVNDVAATGVSTPDVNVVSISGDTTAADNAEAFFDGTGYAGTNNVIPTVTTVNGLAAGVITAASIATSAIDADSLASDAIPEINSGLATAADLTVVDTVVDAILVLAGTTDNAVGQLPDASTIATAVVSGMDSNTSLTRCVQRLGFLMAQEIGACADAGTSAESYTITIDTTTYTIDHVGLDSTGNRGTAVLTQT